MCFNAPFTGFMMALNLGTGLFLQKRGHAPGRLQVRRDGGEGERRCGDPGHPRSFFRSGEIRAAPPAAPTDASRPTSAPANPPPTPYNHHHHQPTINQIYYVFFVMELLQFLQYFVLGDCGHWLNYWTTVLSFAHVCFQPTAINVYVFRNEPNRDVARVSFSLVWLV